MALFSWIVRRKRDFLIEFVDPNAERPGMAVALPKQEELPYDRLRDREEEMTRR
jgi:hypothetical protein